MSFVSADAVGRATRSTLALHCAALLAFALGWAWQTLAPLAAPLPAPLTAAAEEAAVAAGRWPLAVQLEFLASDAAELELLAPPALRAVAAARMRAALRARGAADAAGGCVHAWRVRERGRVLHASAWPAVGREAAALGAAARRRNTTRSQRAGRIRLSILLRRAPGRRTCGRAALGPAERVGWLRVSGAGALAVEACAVNASGEGSGHAAGSALRGALDEFADLLGGISAGGCALAADERAWRPPGRLAMVLLQGEPPAAAARAAQTARLVRLRAASQSLLDAAWPLAPPEIHSQVSSFVSPPWPRQATAVSERQAAALISTWSPQSVTPTPPLKMLFYSATAPAPAAGPGPRSAKPPLALVSASGEALPHDAAFVLPLTGGLSMWRGGGGASDDDDDARLARAAAAQLRVLMGLPAAPSYAAASSHGLAWAEVDALQLGCARALLRSAADDLARLAPLVRRFGRAAAQPGRGSQAMVQHAAAARAAADNATRLVERGAYSPACYEARRSSTHARAALSHPALLPVEYFSVDHTLTAWAPLFFPVATAVGAALVHEVSARRRARREARL